MRSSGSPLVGLLLGFFGPFAAAEFLPGHVYVSTTFSGGPQKGIARIYEVNPQTGALSTFAEQGDHYNVSGLTFTPDGSRLLASEFWPASVLAIDPAGSFSAILDGSDGLGGPFGSNNLTFGPDGALYVADGGSGYIRRFPNGAGPGQIFALSPGYGAIAFGVSGDLFHAPGAGIIRRISPDGTVTMFDDLGPFSSLMSLTTDTRGNIYAIEDSGELHRYSSENAGTHDILASGFGGNGQGSTLAMSPDQTEILLSQKSSILSKLHAIDAELGASRIVATFPSFSPRGMAVFVPEPNTLLLLGMLTVVVARRFRL